MRRAKNLYFSDDECDCCDKHTKVAHIYMGITKFCWCICKDCLNEFVFEFYDEKELRKEKLKKIDSEK